MTERADTVMTRLAESLRSSVNGDGGWPYFSGKTSRIEPTAWAVLALASAASGRSESTDVPLRLMAGWLRHDGLLSEVPDLPANMTSNGIAAVAIQRAIAGQSAGVEHVQATIDALLAGILTTAGLRFPESSRVEQDNQLSGWPWNKGTFSWVEPTASCLLALKKAGGSPRRTAADARITEADRLLADRCCKSGGWNYGNSNVLGKELHPYVPSTALALLALQDRRALPQVVRSVSWLDANWRREPSAMALSLSLVAMYVHGKRVDDIQRTLHGLIAERGIPANLASAAMTLYALTGWSDGYAAFRL
jgi:hypothetical protein